MDDLVLTNTPWDSIKNITFNNSYKVLNKYNLHKKDTLLLEFNSPYSSINKNNITLINNNKTPLDFELININPFKLGIYNNYKVGQEYYFIVNKTIINPDSNNTIPDTIGIKVLSNKSLGNLMCLISNYSDAITNKLLLLYKDDKLLKSKKIIGSQIEFNYLKPGIYSLKLVDDIDNNGKWSNGSFKDKIQPENIIHYKNPLDIKENWDLEVNINL
jgi:hypothetical protein